MKVYRYTYTATATRTIRVKIPDDVTAAEIEKLLDAAIEADDDIDDWDVGGGDWQGTPPKPSARVDDAAWFEVDGHRWATDGECAIREGCPVPAEPSRMGWFTTGQLNADGMRAILAKSAPIHGTAYFQQRFKPILDAGIVVRKGGPLDPVHVQRDGETIAVVMPTKCQTDTIRVEA